MTMLHAVFGLAVVSPIQRSLDPAVRRRNRRRRNRNRNRGNNQRTDTGQGLTYTAFPENPQQQPQVVTDAVASSPSAGPQEPANAPRQRTELSPPGFTIPDGGTIPMPQSRPLTSRLHGVSAAASVPDCERTVNPMVPSTHGGSLGAGLLMMGDPDNGSL